MLVPLCKILSQASLRTVCPLSAPGVGPAFVSCEPGQWVWAHSGRWLPLWPFGFSGPLGAEGFQRWAGGGEWRHRAGAEPAGRSTRHFSLGWCSRVGPGPGSRVAPPGCGSSAGLSQKTPVAVTGRHLAALPGLSRAGAPRRLHAH